jgi:hypothetical protein
MQRIPALPRESEPGTSFLLIETYDSDPGVPGGRKWLALHCGVSKWYYNSEVEKYSEVVSG